MLKPNGSSSSSGSSASTMTLVRYQIVLNWRQGRTFEHRFAPASASGHTGSHTCAKDVNRGWVCWGVNSHGQLGAIDGVSDCLNYPSCIKSYTLPSTFSFASIDAGDGFSCGLEAGGRVLCWGRNDFGQLGRGFSPRYPTNVDLRTQVLPTPINSNLLFRAISVGESHACGIARASNRVWCWGEGTNGQLGNRSLDNSALPVEVITRD